MKQVKASRILEDEEYGTTGYWYYHWPHLKTVFKTDYPDMKFLPEEDTEELTLLEYVALWRKYEGSKEPIGEPVIKDVYYCYDMLDRPCETKTPQHYTGILDLAYTEYLYLFDYHYGPKGPFYYYHEPSDTVFKSDKPVEYYDVIDEIIELSCAQYIEFSIRYDQNHEDTLL